MHVRNSWPINGFLRRKIYHCKSKSCKGSLPFFEELLPELSPSLPPPANTNVKYLFCSSRECKTKYIMTIEEPAPPQFVPKTA